MIKKSLLFLILIIALSGCADSRVSRPDSRFQNFFDRHLGDSLASDALSGFAPIAVGGFIADKFFVTQPDKDFMPYK